MKHGLLVLNIGTPKKADVPSVRAYLREFLTDKRIISLPALLRYLLVYTFILPFRPKKSARAYQAIWTDNGSPLLHISQNLVKQLQIKAGSEYKIVLGMRYGEPSIKTALDSLKHCQSITILPLFPQYSSAATGSSIEAVLRLIAAKDLMPSLKVIRDFYQHPAYVKAQAQLIKKFLAGSAFNNQEHVLFSYHGIPEYQIIKSACKKVCPGICPAISETNQGCYKAQCHQTSFLLAEQLTLDTNQYSTAFQSRLGRTPWIKPWTDEVLADLIKKRIKKLIIVCPSFVTDCLETLEEIGMRAKQQWLDMGGEEFTLVPCMNEDPHWINAILEITSLNA